MMIQMRTKKQIEQKYQALLKEAELLNNNKNKDAKEVVKFSEVIAQAQILAWALNYPTGSFNTIEHEEIKEIP